LFRLINIDNLKSLNDVVAGTLSCQNEKFTSIVVDSRKATEGSVFLALKGSKYNGNDFCQEAINKGAVAVISDNNADHINTIKVDSGYIALLKLAQYQQQQIKPITVAITGSNGKTTVKEMLAHLCSNQNAVVTHKNENNEFGIPFTVLKLRQETKYLILECGARNLGDFDLISEYLEFDIIAITNINNSHVGVFGSIENIIKTKTRLFDGLKKDGLILDGVGFKDISKPLNKWSGDTSSVSIYQNQSMEFWKSSSDPINDVGKYNLSFHNKEDEIYTIDRINLGAKHNEKNALISFLIAKKIGIELEVILNKLSTIQRTLSNRFFIKRIGRHIFVDDTYNANPASMHAAINELISNKFYPKNKVIILGDMLELGIDATKEHLRLLEKISLIKDLESIFIKGDNFKKALEEFNLSQKNDSIYYFDKTEEFPIERTLNLLKKPSVILVKGSRGMKMEKIVDLLSINIEK